MLLILILHLLLIMMVWRAHATIEMRRAVIVATSVVLVEIVLMILVMESTALLSVIVEVVVRWSAMSAVSTVSTVHRATVVTL